VFSLVLQSLQLEFLVLLQAFVGFLENRLLFSVGLVFLLVFVQRFHDFLLVLVALFLECGFEILVDVETVFDAAALEDVLVYYFLDFFEVALLERHDEPLTPDSGVFIHAHTHLVEEGYFVDGGVLDFGPLLSRAEQDVVDLLVDLGLDLLEQVQVAHRLVRVHLDDLLDVVLVRFQPLHQFRSHPVFFHQLIQESVLLLELLVLHPLFFSRLAFLVVIHLGVLAVLNVLRGKGVRVRVLSCDFVVVDGSSVRVVVLSVFSGEVGVWIGL